MAKKERIEKQGKTDGEKAIICLVAFVMILVVTITFTLYAAFGFMLCAGAFTGVSALNLPSNGTFRSAITSTIDKMLESDLLNKNDTNSNTFSVNFDTNGGEMPDGEKTNRYVVKGHTIGALPIPEKEGYVFVGWFETEYNKLIEVEATTTVEYDMELIAIWGEGVNIYLNPNGGTLPTNSGEVHEAILDRSIGRLPTPIYPGHEFLGWYESGTNRLVNSVTLAERDIEIVAHWRALDTTLAIEFNVGVGEEFVGEASYFEIVRGERITSVMTNLPSAKCEGYKFMGWYDQNGVGVSVTTKVENDLVLKPKWEKIIYCLDGTENHSFGAWNDFNEATCTMPARRARQCLNCGHFEYYETGAAKGHSFGRWVVTKDEYDMLIRKCECKNALCEEAQIQPLTSITYASFKTPTLDGDIFGKPDPGTLINGLYDDKNIAGKGTSAVTATIEAKSPTHVDVFTVTGEGSSSYTVIAVDENGEEHIIDRSSFGGTRFFEINAIVTKIIVYMESPSEGTDYWQELGCYVIEQNN